LGGCTNNPLNTEINKFVGTWTTQTGGGINTSMDLFSNGTFSMMGTPGTWGLKDGKFVVQLSDNTGGIVTAIYNYVFSNKDKTLTLTNSAGGSPEVWIKQ
jgi:hypothetical protein